MTFWQAVVTVYKDKNCRFHGRASRSEYWWSLLFMVIALILGGLVAGALATFFGKVGKLCGGIAFLVLLAILLTGHVSVLFRRFQDLNISRKHTFLVVFFPIFLINALGRILPWFAILGLIFILGLFIFLSRRGTIGVNSFGPDPVKQEEQNTNFEQSQYGGFNPFQEFTQDDSFVNPKQPKSSSSSQQVTKDFWNKNK